MARPTMIAQRSNRFMTLKLLNQLQLRLLKKLPSKQQKNLLWKCQTRNETPARGKMMLLLLKFINFNES